MNEHTILIVDDEPINIKILADLLQKDFKIRTAYSGTNALEILSKPPKPDLILLDIMMPDMDGFEVCRRIKDHETSQDIPVIFVTASNEDKDEIRGLELGAADFIRKPIKPHIVMARVKAYLALYDHERYLDRTVHEKTKLLHATQIKVAQRLGRAGEYKDNETAYHIKRMSNYARLLGISIGMSEDKADILMSAAALHDIGKVGIPDSILLKPGKLDDHEFETMKSHCEIGAEIIGDDDSDLFQMAKTIALTHHEKWDGSGYPKGLAGENIPIVGRIAALADVYDALTSERPYKKAFSADDAVKILESAAGTHFDPEMVLLFVKSLPEILEIEIKYSEESFL